MKLGRDTGSLMNHVMSQEGGLIPKVGMGVTVLHWSDRSPATIVEVATTRGGQYVITILEDDAKRTDNNGFSECQEYEYTPNPNAHKQMYRWEPKKGWRSVKYNEAKSRLVLTGSSQTIRVGEREKFHDFSF